MFRRGKSEGWLSLPATDVAGWSERHSVQYPKLGVGSIPGKGTGLVASAGVTDADNPILFVPNDIIIYPKTIQRHAQDDAQLREVLAAVGEFGETPRGAILLSLLMSATHNCPQIEPRIGQPNHLSEYIKFLPLENLPTLWSKDELNLLVATTLAPALDAKLRKLRKEFERVKSSTKSIAWCEQHWWDNTTGHVNFEDWKHVDAIYRSRALEIDGIGHCMIPVIDMANHGFGSHVEALYGNDEDDNAILMLRWGKTLVDGDEISVPYGDEKGACEMIFSYGFIDSRETTAKTLFLGIEVPDDDPLKLAKIAIDLPPGFRLIDEDDGIDWEGAYVWLICVNEEDGLGFNYKRLPNGEPEMIVTWEQFQLENVSELEGHLQRSRLWDVYQLRAISLLKGRVEQQLQRIRDTADIAESLHGPGTSISDQAWVAAMRLRSLEGELLERARHQLDRQMHALLESEVVLEYLRGDGSDAEGQQSDL